MTDFFARALAAVCGAGIVTAITHVSVVRIGGYNELEAVTLIALAIALITGSFFVGAAWGNGQYANACFLAVAILSGEYVAARRTLDSALLARSARLEPGRDHAARHRDATLERDRARTSLDSADAAIRDSAALRECAANCRMLLMEAKTKADARFDKAVADLALVGRPQLAATPAEALGIDPARDDLFTAIAMSLSLNGIAIALLSFAAHPRQRKPNQSPALPVSNVSKIERTVVDAHAVELPSIVIETDIFIHVDEFAHATIKPSRSGSVSMSRVYAAYAAWCAARSLRPIGVAEFLSVMTRLCEGVGLGIRDGRTGPMIEGVRLEVTPLVLVASSGNAA
jgi:hypothetical protein